MTEHRKISRVLQMIARLRQPLGWTKEDLASTFEVSVRTIERYINLLRELGFRVTQNGQRFRIDQPGKESFCHEDLIVFTLEEAKIIKDALLSHQPGGPLRNVLLDKLFAMTDIDQLANTFSSLNQSNVISTVNLAISEKKQVILKAYDAADHQPRDILVEPIQFNAYFRYLRAFDLQTKQNKLYKTERIADAEIVRNTWAYEEKHEKPGIDAFGISGTNPVEVHLQLSKRAKQLLTEEFPDTTPGVKGKGTSWYFKGTVFGFAGVGRFVLGLPGEVAILSPPGLIAYVVQKIKNHTGMVHLKDYENVD
jgi:proteasome accessory factor C